MARMDDTRKPLFLQGQKSASISASATFGNAKYWA
jgi:hypothetical protein